MKLVGSGSKFSVFAVSVVLAACGGGGGGGGGNPTPTNVQPDTPITLPEPGGTLPPGVLQYGVFKEDIVRMYVAKGNGTASVVFEHGAGGTGAVDLGYTSFVSNNWGAAYTIKSGVQVSDVHFAVSGDGDAHVAWYTPGTGIVARSKVNGAWYGESTLTKTGACLDLSANPSGSEVIATWCESGGGVGFGHFATVSWVNMGTLKDGFGDEVLGTNPTNTVLSDGRFVVSWTGMGVGSDGVSPVSSVNVGEFLNSGQMQSSDVIAELPVNAAPMSEVFGDGAIRGLSFTAIDSSTITFNVALYSSGWGSPAKLNQAPDGYTDSRLVILDNGDPLVSSMTLGRKMQVQRFSNGGWQTLLSANDVFYSDFAQVNGKLLMLYTTSSGSKIVEVSDSGVVERLVIANPVYDVGLVEYENKLLAVWRDNGRAMYLVGSF